MTLKSMLDLVNKYDKISIHSETGNVIFDGEMKELLHSEISEYLDHKVDQIRPYHDILIIALAIKED